MMAGSLLQALRWLFWALVYLATFFTAVLAMGEAPVPPIFRLLVAVVVVFGIVVDVLHKLRADADRSGQGAT